MKLLLIHTSDYLHHPVPSRQHSILEELQKRHEVHVAHFHVSRGETRKTDLWIEEVTLLPLTSPLLHYTLNAPYHYYMFDKILRENRVDIVIVSNILASSAAIRAAKKYKIPVIFDLSDWLPDSAAAYVNNQTLKEIVKWTVWQITERNLRSSDKIVTVSPTLVDRLKALGFDSELITNGVDTEYFKPLDGKVWRKKFGIDQNVFVIGFAGSLERWYDLTSMIKALPALLEYNPMVRLLVVGPTLFTGYERELKDLATSLGVLDKVSFVGRKPYTELPQWISCMDVCTIPLLPEQWGDIALPNKFFEYSACGKPILMRPMGNVEKIGGKNLFIYHNQEEYIGHIKNLMWGSPVFVPLDLESYSWAAKAKQFENIFKGLGVGD